MTKALQQVTVPKWPQGEPVHEMLSWEESLTMLRVELNWKVHPKRYQDKMQEQYAQNMGVHTHTWHANVRRLQHMVGHNDCRIAICPHQGQTRDQKVFQHGTEGQILVCAKN